MVTSVFYLILLQGQQNVLLYGFHRSKSELDVHSNFSSESFTTQFLREVSYDIVLTDRYLKYWLDFYGATNVYSLVMIMLQYVLAVQCS